MRICPILLLAGAARSFAGCDDDCAWLRFDGIGDVCAINMAAEALSNLSDIAEDSKKRGIGTAATVAYADADDGGRAEAGTDSARRDDDTGNGSWAHAARGARG